MVERDERDYLYCHSGATPEEVTAAVDDIAEELVGMSEEDRWRTEELRSNTEYERKLHKKVGREEFS